MNLGSRIQVSLNRVNHEKNSINNIKLSLTWRKNLQIKDNFCFFVVSLTLSSFLHMQISKGSQKYM